MEWNTVERTIKAETDTRTEEKKKEWERSVGLGPIHEAQREPLLYSRSAP